PDPRDPWRGVPVHLGAVRRRRRRTGRGAEVPAADDLGVRAALLEALAERPRPADGAHDPGDDGARRDVRQGRRRLSSLLCRRALAGAALREDALRQRPARLALPARLARVPRSRVALDLPGGPPLSP